MMGEGSSLQNAPVASINDNEIYFNVVGGGKKKKICMGLVY